MFDSYVISSELEEKIENSNLLEKYPTLKERPFLGLYHLEDILEDIIYGPYDITKIINLHALSLVSNDNLTWKLKKEVDGKEDLFGNTEILQRKQASLSDISLGTGYLLPHLENDDESSEGKKIDTGELLQFKKYGFFSALEMIMSLSAYRGKNTFQEKQNQYEWVNSKGIRNVITACTHGDTKFYQHDENVPGKVVSPYGNEVHFFPRECIGAMTQVYHSHEPSFFATFFRYAYECGVLRDIMGERGEKFIQGSESLPGSLGNYGDAGMGSYVDFSNALFGVCIPIGGNSEMRNVHTQAFGPNQNDEPHAYYEFKIGGNGELELHNAYASRIDMIFYPEDCEDLLKGILHQCAHGHGRTSKKQIIEIVKYIYGGEIIEEVDKLDGIELPHL